MRLTGMRVSVQNSFSLSCLWGTIHGSYLLKSAEYQCLACVYALPATYALIAACVGGISCPVMLHRTFCLSLSLLVMTDSDGCAASSCAMSRGTAGMAVDAMVAARVGAP
jgi:hypothetical protein